MARQYSLAFTIAVVVGLLGTEIMRRVATATGFVDKPGGRDHSYKIHTREIPYLGGIAIAASVFAGWLFESAPGLQIEIAALAAAGIAVLGLVDDARDLHPVIRLLIECAAALVVIAAGVRAVPTGIEPLDLVVTFLWIVGVTNAVNLLDNMDGVTAGLAAATASGAFVLAAMGGLEVVGTASAAVVGACIGFLAYNARPASIFMGDSGALFLGFTLSIIVLEIETVAVRPGSFLVPVLLLAIPALNVAVIAIGRLRNGRSFMAGGKDSLTHRLVSLGLTPGIAVLALVAVQAALAALAVAIGRDALALAFGIPLSAAVVLALLAVAGRARVYT